MSSNRRFLNLVLDSRPSEQLTSRNEPSKQTNKNTSKKPTRNNPSKDASDNNRRGSNVTDHTASNNSSRRTSTTSFASDEMNPFKQPKEDRDNYDKSGMTALMKACRKNDYEMVNSLIKRGVNVEEYDTEGRTALFHAATFSTTEVISLLFEGGANPFIVAGYYEKNCLHKACSRTDESALAVVQLFLEKMGSNARLEQDKVGMLPLHIAISNGKMELVNLLLENSVADQIKAVNYEHGDSALHLAARKCNTEAIRLLVENGASVNTQNADGQTPLHISAHEQDVKTVHFFSECKAVVGLKDSNNRTATNLATTSGNMEIVKLLVDEFHSDLQQRSQDGSTLLHLAAKCGHPDICLYLISKGVLVQMPNKDGASALHEAARQGHAHVVNTLISKGAAIDTATKDGYTALHVAVMYGKHSVVQVLLGEGATVNQLGGERQESPLHLAAKLQRHSEQVVQMLVRSGIKIDQKDGHADTPLHVAVRHNNYAIAKMLRKEGVKVGNVNDSGETALHVAAKNLSIAIALELLDDMRSLMTKEQFTQTVNQRNKKGETVLHYCGSIQPSLSAQKTYTDFTKLVIDNHAELDILNNETEETPLHYCCHSGNAEVMRMILSSLTPSNASKLVNKINKNGWSPILIASNGGFASVVKLLLEYQARIDLFDENGKNALHISCENGHLQVAEILLSKRAYADAKTKAGETPVSLAASKGHNQIVERLVAKYKASYEIPSLEKQVSLHKAAENGHIHACKTLLNFGANAYAKDLQEQTPIHAACENNHPSVVQMFLDRYPDLGGTTNQEGNNCAHIAASKGSLEVMKMLVKSDRNMISKLNKLTGQQPIHVASGLGHLELVELLLEEGASVQEEDKEGYTPMHLAAKFGHTPIIEVLKSKISLSVVSAKNGLSPIHSAAEFDQEAVLALLLLKIPSHALSECPTNKNPEETEHGLTPLHLASYQGNEGIVRKLIQTEECVLDQKTSNDGLTALHCAIKEGRTEVASLLLSRSADLISLTDANGRSPLHIAASSGHVKLVQLLLGQGALVDDEDKNNWTPLHHAANAGHLEVTQFLVEQDGSTIATNADEKMPIIYAARNLHLDTLKFLCQREYDVENVLDDAQFLADLTACSKRNNNQSVLDLILYSPAPIYTSIMLRVKFSDLADVHKDKSADFIHVSDYCEEVTYKLLNLAAPYGKEALLNAVDDISKKALLDLLVDYEFKDSVSHPSIQSYVSEIWSGDVDLQGNKGTYLAAAMFLFPPLWFFLCLPVHKWNKIPTVKFICHLISHLYFIFILSIAIIVPWDRSGREIYPLPWDCLLLIWLVALYLAQLTEEESTPIRLFVCITSAIAIGVNIWAVFESGHDRATLMYYRDNIFAFTFLALVVQLFEFLQMHEIFGPWIVIIYALIIDVLKFLVVLFTVIGAFSLHMVVIYKPAYDKEQIDFPTKVVENLNVFNDINTIFKDLFFAMFGLSSLPPAELTAVQKNWNPAETATIGVVVFAMYQIVAIIILVNLLIAMMGNTYAIIDERSETEWKYGRARIIWNMTKTTSVPVPINIFVLSITFFQVLFLSRFVCCTANVSKVHKDMLKYGGLHESDDEEGSDHENESPRKEGADETQKILTDVVPWPEITEQYLEIEE
eukprot:TCONS_00027873-protein